MDLSGRGQFAADRRLFPTRIDSAARHLQLGRLTVIEPGNQLIGILLTIAAALILQSVWALVWGNVLGAVAQLVTFRLFLPGHINRLRMEPEARHEVMKFGKWIFFSTICGFLLFQGDRIILVRVDAGPAGRYNIGLFLATVPMMLWLIHRDAAVHSDVSPAPAWRKRRIPARADPDAGGAVGAFAVRRHRAGMGRAVAGRCALRPALSHRRRHPCRHCLHPDDHGDPGDQL